MSGGFELSSNLVGHENDVKGVVYVNNKTIGSVSRDCTLREWKKQEAGNWRGRVLYKSPRYLNSVGISRGLFVCGGQDSKISVVSEASHPFSLNGHESNVCALDSKGDVMVSGSWDSSARVWVKDAPKYTLDGHSAAVWDAKVVDAERMRFLTAGADKKILLWDGNNVEKTFVGHEDVVRGLCLIDDKTFASCSNDGTVKIWGFDGSLRNTLHGHTNFVYQVADLGSGEIISVGEGGEVRIWNLKECVQAISLPAVSVWCVGVDQSGSGDFAVAGSDYIIRIFSREQSRWASQEERDQLAESVASKVNTADIDESQIKDRSILNQPPQKEGQVVMVRNESGTIEAHQSSGGQWIRVGEVVSSKEAAAKNSSKKELDGKEYDYVFQVNIEDGKPELPLPYNSDENPYDSARRFLEKNELPMSYLDEVAQFITSNAVVKNTQKSYNPYADRATGPAQSQPTATATPTTLKVVPHREYVKLMQYQPDPIYKALVDKNAKQSTSALTEDQLQTIRQGLNNMDANAAQQLFSLTAKVALEWSPEDMLPILDIFRIAVGYHPQPQAAIAVQVIFSTLDPGAPKHALLATRALVNLFGSNEGRVIAGSKDVRENALEAVHKMSESAEGATSARNIAIASLMLNYSILAGTNVDTALTLIRSMAFITQNMKDSESRYRLLLAIGTLIANNRNDYIKQEAKELGITDWVKSLPVPDDRTSTLVDEVVSVV